MRPLNWLTIITATLLLCAGCDSPVSTSVDEPIVGTDATVLQAQLRPIGFTLDVNTLRRMVSVSAPLSPRTLVTPVLQPLASMEAMRRLSLLGGDAVEVTLSNYQAGAIGADVPGKIRVTLDMTLTNRLGSVSLGTATWPTPPVGTQGVLAIPFEIAVINGPGRSSSGGNAVTVLAPRSGIAQASTDWDGAPHSFFSSAACTADNNDCFPYEPFGFVARGGQSQTRRVGFLMDPTVADFRVRFLIAADLLQ